MPYHLAFLNVGATSPEVERRPSKMMVGNLSFWGPTYFQGRTVSLRECNHTPFNATPHRKEGRIKGLLTIFFSKYSTNTTSFPGGVHLPKGWFVCSIFKVSFWALVRFLGFSHPRCFGVLEMVYNPLSICKFAGFPCRFINFVISVALY